MDSQNLTFLMNMVEKRECA